LHDDRSRRGNDIDTYTLSLRLLVLQLSLAVKLCRLPAFCEICEVLIVELAVNKGNDVTYVTRDVAAIDDISQAARQGLAVLMATAEVVLKHQTSTTYQSHIYKSIDLKFG